MSPTAVTRARGLVLAPTNLGYRAARLGTRRGGTEDGHDQGRAREAAVEIGGTEVGHGRRLQWRSRVR
jgi:hypothetical protein